MVPRYSQQPVNAITYLLLTMYLAWTPLSWAADPDGVDWGARSDVPSSEYESCLGLAYTFGERCDEIAARWAEADCRRSGRQSGCAMWKVGCFSPFVPGQVFSAANCSRPGFFQCASATYPGYLSCVDACNTAKDRGKCLHERCQAQARVSLGRCGEDGFSVNAWREPKGGSSEAQPGSDEAVMAAMTGEASRDMARIYEQLGTGRYGGAVMQGDVFAVRDGRSIPLEEAGLFPPDTVLLSRGHSKLLLPDGSQLKIGPMGVFKYDDQNHIIMPMGTFSGYRNNVIQFQPGFGHLYIHHAADSKLNRLWRNVRTTARASLRLLRVFAKGVRVGLQGTRLVVETNPLGGLDRVLVLDGIVNVEGTTSGNATLSTGQMIISRDGVLEAPEAMPEEEWSGALAQVGGSDGDLPTVGAAPTAEKQSAEEVPTAAAPGSGSRCAAIVGAWRWFNGAMVECLENGRCVATNGFEGVWRCLDTTGRLEIQWSRPGQAPMYVDTLIIGSDGDSITGNNLSGHPVSGQRVKFSGGKPQPGCQALAGRWRWSGNVDVQCRADGSCSASNGLIGRWQCTDDAGSFRLSWSAADAPDKFIDTVWVSPLGSFLSGHNQYGSAITATRE